MPLTETQSRILRTVHRSNEPLSGRRIAAVTGYAANTVNKALAYLEKLSAVTSTTSGKSRLWTATPGAIEWIGAPLPTENRVALVVTAVGLEHEAVRQRLINAQRERVDNLSLLRGELPGDVTNWTIHLAQAGMGNASTAALVGLAAGQLNANVVAFVGTAGGLRPDEYKYGDVIVASHVHNIYSGKQVVDGEGGSTLLSRGRTYAAPAPLLSLANAVINDTAWTHTKASPHFRGQAPHAYVEPIVAVDAVQADPDGPLIQEIRRHYQNAVAIDMESVGLAAGSDVHDLPMLAVRGISDFLGDKNPVKDTDRQPAAASNAAAFLFDLLTRASPEDFLRGRAALQSPSDPDFPGPETRLELPEPARLWEQRLERAAPRRARAARSDIADLRTSGSSIATWINRALHRPPMWLRDDDTGDGWALVAVLGDFAKSSVTGRAYKRAADSATVTGNTAAAAWFSMLYALRPDPRLSATDALRDSANVRTDQGEFESSAAAALRAVSSDQSVEEPTGRPATDAAFIEALQDLPPYVHQALAPIVEFYLTLAQGDLPDTKRAGAKALAFLGYHDHTGVLGFTAMAVTTAAAAESLEEDLRVVIAANVLIQLSHRFLFPGAADELDVDNSISAPRGRGNPVTGDLADDAEQMAAWAVQLRSTPATELSQAQARLAVLLSTAARSVVHNNSTAMAIEIEHQALRVRDVHRHWQGVSGAAVSVAARARELQGDLAGALRITRPSPDGLATTSEAQDPDVVRVAAHLAAELGDADLALELTAQVSDAAESQLFRATLLARRPGMYKEAEQAYADALMQANGRRHVMWQALLGLVRCGETLSSEHRQLVNENLALFEASDPGLADLVRAREALIRGEPEQALKLARRHPKNELSLEIRAEALSALGRAEEAVDQILEQANASGDVLLVLEATRVAIHYHLLDKAREIAVGLLSTYDSTRVRVQALETLQRVERADGNWPAVAQRTRQIMDEETRAGNPVDETQPWMLAEACYFTRQYEDALAALLRADDGTPLSLDDRDEVRLLFSILQLLFQERREPDAPRTANDLGGPAFDLFLRAATRWAHDEPLAAFALNLALTSPNASLSEAQLLKVREFTEHYFQQHGEDASIRQVPFDEDNLDALIEQVRTTAVQVDAQIEINEKVITGQLPLAALTQTLGRSYAAVLLRRDFGMYVSLGADDQAGSDAVLRALQLGRIVADTSALVVGPLCGIPLSHLTSEFDSVAVHPAHRRDLARARADLAMLPVGTLGWDSRSQNLVVTQHGDDEVKAWRDRADAVWESLRLFDEADPRVTVEDEFWSAPVFLAQRTGKAVWSDDLALRRFARSLGVPAFSTLDLVRATHERPRVAIAEEAFRENHVADLPINGAWQTAANQAGWNVRSPFAEAICRPFAWRDPREAFSRYRAMMRFRPQHLAADQIAGWAHLAAIGLALTLKPDSRHEVVPHLLTWTILNTDSFFDQAFQPGHHHPQALPEGSGEVMRLLLGVSRQLRDRFYPAADDLEPMIGSLADILRSGVGAEQAGRLVTTLASTLGDDLRRRVVSAFLRNAT